MSRWLRWTLLCWRGRRCADLRVEVEPDDVPSLPTLHIEYVCGTCGTAYHYDTRTRARTRI